MHPALALLEFDSVAAGILAGDAMVKRGPITEIVTGTVHPGRYLVMVTGDVAAVEEAVAGGREVAAGSLIDAVVLSDVHGEVVAAIRGGRRPVTRDALGVVETRTVAATIEAADAAVKGASVTILAVHLADGLGGKAYVLFGGDVSDVQAAVAIGVDRIDPALLVGQVVIPRLHGEIERNLAEAPRFGGHLGWEAGADAAG